jgi:hypothetical protein
MNLIARASRNRLNSLLSRSRARLGALALPFEPSNLRPRPLPTVRFRDKILPNPASAACIQISFFR